MPDSKGAFWVEIVSRHGEVLSRHRIATGEAFVGRSYDSDVIVDDPYVAARHLRIARDAAGTLIAEDLGSANGLLDDRTNRREPRIELGPAHSVRIGRTHLRVRESGHAVEPERVLRSHAWGWPVTVALVVLMGALQLCSTWLSQTTQPKFSDYATPLLTVCLFVAIWAGGWALVCRIFSGRAQFQHNLRVAVTGLAVAIVLYDAAEVAAFALSQRAFGSYRYIALWLGLAFVAYLHLRLVSVSHMRIKVGAVALLAVTAIGLQALSLSQSRASSGGQNFVRKLKPPTLRLAAQQSEDTFFAAAGALKQKLDQERLEPVVDGWEGAEDDD